MKGSICGSRGGQTDSLPRNLLAYVRDAHDLLLIGVPGAPLSGCRSQAT
jgi:hypothetical protein